MKRVILVLIMLLVPATLAAQEKDASLATDQQGDTASAPSVASLGAQSDDATIAPNPSLFSDASAEPASATSPPQTSSPSTTTQPESPTRPPIQGSMVGYIDDPIVESQIRIRFDGAFDDQYPDRSEFFYGKCGCYRSLPVKSGGNDPNAPGPPPGPGVIVPTNLNFQQLYILAEFAPERRFSVFAEVPVRWIQAQGLLTPPGDGPFPNEGGLSDVMAGFKVAAVASERTYLTFQVRAYFPTGDASKGLGTNHYSIEPEALLYHRFSGRLTLEGQLGDWHPIGGSAGVPAGPGSTTSEGFAGDIFTWGIGPSYKLITRNRVTFTPVLEFVGWDVLSGFETLPGGPVNGLAREVSGTNIINVKIGARTSIGLHNSVYIGYGHALTSANWYDQIVRAEYRYVF